MNRALYSRLRGFTLLEVLVVLAITGLLVSILMSLLYYVSRVQDALSIEVVEREFALRSRAWFTESVSACMPGTLDSAFQGESQVLACDSLVPLLPSVPRSLEHVRFLLVKGERGQNELRYEQSGATSNSDEAVILTRLPDGEATFVYSGIDGVEYDHWPRKNGNVESLPRQVRLIVKSAGSTYEWFAFPLADPWLEPVIANPFGIELPK